MSDEILNELQALRDELNVLRTIQNNNDEKDFLRIKSTIEDSLVNSVEIENKLIEVTNRIKATELFNVLISINNPESRALGFKFTDVVKVKAVDILTREITSEKARNRFSSVLKKVLNNPIASVLIESNPVAGVISNVVNFASDFLDTELSDNGLFQKTKIITKDVIKEERIEEFNESLSKHIELFSGLNASSIKLDLKVESLMEKAKILNASFIGINQKLRSKLSLPLSGGYSSELQQRLSLTNDEYGFKKYSNLLSDREVIEAYNISLFLESEKNAVNELVDNYSKVLKGFLEDYKGILENTKGSIEEIDDELVDNVIAKIENYENDMFKVHNDKVLLRDLETTKIIAEKNMFH
ncbi:MULTISPECIES: hypothetical protein [unclassified Pseudoalteromonas]|jgi:hypothetical protein|uniref:hypothetical protein n=1 Tax=unclassified Pseudoalteromonas TaxID=194690 RepID=UPI0023591B63|nr:MULTISPECIES: hypothetical protein [unclassified Pseudoalteromonas]MDC9502733.1 hypothetical protein [Pseudoalteromonas sp. Angola-18]MDC9530432.1 hypothetical protein [Pseudoalteromonas sp. Angola-7]